MHVGVPPGYSVRIDEDGNLVLIATGENLDRLRSMPAALLEELSLNSKRGLYNQRCFWFDATTRRCRHYDFRPTECRTFEVGGVGCLAIRSFHGFENPL
jgi:Fe-S-cluster containining protein